MSRSMLGKTGIVAIAVLLAGGEALAGRGGGRGGGGLSSRGGARTSVSASRNVGGSVNRNVGGNVNRNVNANRNVDVNRNVNRDIDVDRKIVLCKERALKHSRELVVFGAREGLELRLGSSSTNESMIMSMPKTNP